MSESTVKTCDVCGERQLSSNGWIRYRDPPLGNFMVLQKKGKQTASHKDGCGRACLIQAFNVWLGEVHVNAPAEVRKNETP